VGGKVVSHSCGRAAAQSGAAIGGTPCASISDFEVGANDFGNSRNSLRGPGFFDTDLSVLKNFKITRFEISHLLAVFVSDDRIYLDQIGADADNVRVVGLCLL